LVDLSFAMPSIALALLSLTYLAAAEEGSAFGDDAPVAPPKRKGLTLRKPAPVPEESESAFGDVDLLKDERESKSNKLSSETPEEESAFGDVDYLQDVAEIAHAAPTSKPSLRKKSAQEYEESAFGELPVDDKSGSLDEKELQQLDEKQSLVEEAALAGELKEDAEDELDDEDMKAKYEAPHGKSGEGLDAMSDTKSGLPEYAEDDSAPGDHAHEHEVRPAQAKGCTGPQCEAEKWSPVRNVHAYGPSGKPANWKPRRILGNGKELVSDEPARERGPRIYSRHMAVEHQSPPKRSLGEFMSSFMER